jgi:hypothetical protein
MYLEEADWNVVNCITTKTQYGTEPPTSIKCFKFPDYRGNCWFLKKYASFPPRRPGFEPRSGQMGFVVDKVALG